MVIGEEGTAVVSEELCVGCGICIKKCPFAAIDIVSLPEELPNPTHRYGKNAFALYGLPIPVPGKVTGLLGPNGIGKSTAVQILSGSLRPNMGELDREVPWKEILSHYAGTELFEYLRMVSEGRVKTATKPQYIDYIPRMFRGTVGQLLKTTDERGQLERYVDAFSLSPLMDRAIDSLSGGELQRVAICACLSREADFYFLDEITPFLDIYQRMAAATLIRELAAERPIMIVEHDLAILDLVADTVHIAFGKPAVFGIVTQPKGVRVGINQYLEGYLAEENMRFRDYPVVFESRLHGERPELEVLAEIPPMGKAYPDFTLDVGGGEIHCGEVLGIVGPNGIGKTTFARLLAGEETPNSGKAPQALSISYKPQYPEGRLRWDGGGDPAGLHEPVRHLLLPARGPGAPRAHANPRLARKDPLGRRAPAARHRRLPLPGGEPLHPGRTECTPGCRAAGEAPEGHPEPRPGAGSWHHGHRP